MKKDKLIALIKNIDTNYSDENIVALNTFLENNPIRFKKYFNNTNGEQAILTTFNNTGDFDHFETNVHYGFGDLLAVRIKNDILFVETKDIFFD